MISDRECVKRRLLRDAVSTSIVFAAAIVLCQTGQRAGQIAGTIKDPDGGVIPKALVVLSSHDVGMAQMRGTADAAGRFAFSNIPYGTYELSVSAPGYREPEPRLVIVTSPMRVLDLTMIPLRRLTTPENGGDANLQKESRQTPAFSPAGVRGTTAPSGYSTGLSSEETSQVNHSLNQLGIEIFAALVPEASAISCNQEPTLLRAVESDPRAFGPNRDLGLFYLGHGDLNHSIQYLQAAHLASPEDENTSRDLSVALLVVGRDADAIAILEPLARREHKEPALLKVLAMAYEAAGNAEKSKSAYRQAAALDDGAANQFDCGMGLIRLGAAEEARNLLTAAASAHPESARLWMGLGVAEDILEHKAPAVQRLLRAVEIDPEYFPPYSLLADLSDSVPGTQGEIRNRIAEFVVAHRESSVAHFDFALALWKQSRSDAAVGSKAEIVAQLKAALERDPKLTRAHFILGEIYADAADLAGAEKELRAALASEPDNAQTHYRLSQVYRREGKSELAGEEIEKFRSLHGKLGEDATTPLLNLRQLAYGQAQSISGGGSCPPMGK